MKIEKGMWVADGDPLGHWLPRVAKVADVYDLFDERLADIVYYSPTGHRVGRISPALGGPANFEPAVDTEHMVPIEEPEWPIRANHQFSGKGNLLVPLAEKED